MEEVKEDAYHRLVSLFFEIFIGIIHYRPLTHGDMVRAKKYYADRRACTAPIVDNLISKGIGRRAYQSTYDACLPNMFIRYNIIKWPMPLGARPRSIKNVNKIL